MPIDYSKFKNIGDEDSDDEADGGDGATQGATQPKRPTPTDVTKRDMATVALEPNLTNDSECLKAFTEFFSVALTKYQRMQTLIVLWNKSEETERVQFVQALVRELGDEEGTNIKGGQGVLRDMPEEFYKGVTYPKGWADQWPRLQTRQKVRLMMTALAAVCDEEKKLIVSTLV